MNFGELGLRIIITDMVELGVAAVQRRGDLRGGEEG